ncbi:DoxX family membrane protein [Leptobacterium flavescens]|uniref:DoxX family membrane protein n=1 Tax=Leptobacterium flavescens TaxID=472055 RepID=A0A6P0UF62_9FLAO|nr:DoxX family membrane protein [Leptobacterium flavescens]NER11885.1 DoxX family membrane protein [Leptobacterium flavescens]
MQNGNFLIRLGFALLFIWGGLEKFIEGFLGGVGLNNMAEFLKGSGLDFLGDTGALVVAAILAAVELLAGIALLLNKELFKSYIILAFIMLMALVLVHIPSGNWMNIMIHLAIFLVLLGLGLNSKPAK